MKFIKKNIKKIIPATLVFTLMISNVTIPSSGNLNLSSTVYAASYTGSKPPLGKCVAKGKLYKGNKHANYRNASAAAAALASIMGVPIKTAINLGSKMYSCLKLIGDGKVYYTRQQYTNAQGDLYYYKYTYYKKQNYTGQIGVVYSHLYSKWP